MKKFLINDEYRILEELNEYEYDKIIYDSNYNNKYILMKYILNHNNFIIFDSNNIFSY